MCYNFKERRVVPTHYAIRTHDFDILWPHLKPWLVEMWADGKSWREVPCEEDNEQLNSSWFTATFPIAVGGECCFIRLANIGRNHRGGDPLSISACESSEPSLNS
jgi:hypothetical protein